MVVGELVVGVFDAPVAHWGSGFEAHFGFEGGDGGGGAGGMWREGGERAVEDPVGEGVGGLELAVGVGADEGGAGVGAFGEGGEGGEGFVHAVDLGEAFAGLDVLGLDVASAEELAAADRDIGQTGVFTHADLADADFDVEADVGAGEGVGDVVHSLDCAEVDRLAVDNLLHVDIPSLRKLCERSGRDDAALESTNILCRVND